MSVVTPQLRRRTCGAPDRAGSFAKRYRVDANLGDTLSFRLTSPSFDAYLTLHGQSGQPVESERRLPRLDGAVLHPRVSRAGAGRYVIEATTVGRRDTGPFSLSVVKERAPNLPQAIGTNFRRDSATSIGIGTTTPDSEVVFKATVTDPNPLDSVRLQVEVVDTTSPFSGTPNDSGSFVGVGQTASVLRDSLKENKGFHWQARTCDKTKRCSGWLSFGVKLRGRARLPGQRDSRESVDRQLVIESVQRRRRDSRRRGTGGGLGSAQTVTFKATVTDPDPATRSCSRSESSRPAQRSMERRISTAAPAWRRAAPRPPPRGTRCPSFKQLPLACPGL